ncbi:uridylate kinase [Hypoxylon sp. FL1284]|nr:uridylate kinase [Hypoxylon sp. FL1284]
MSTIDSLKDRTTPVFSADDVTVLFVLGGPGAGKGTQCERLVARYGFAHLSAGDLLRAEQARPDSEFGELIRDHIRNGLIVPMEVTIALLEAAMRQVLDEPTAVTDTASADKSTGRRKGKFLIDGFPRKLDQAVKFEEAVVPARFVLFFDCPEAEMERRLLERGKTSGREDDNAESIRKRFRTFVDTSMPVVDYFDKQGRVVRVDATPAPDQVFVDTQAHLAKRLSDDVVPS